MSKPVIGISTYREQADWGSWRQVQADLLPAAYANAIVDSGGIPLLLPPCLDRAGASAAAARLDGLLIAGGADLDPALYDQQPHPDTAGWRTDRDASEGALLDAATARQLPTLGVCRGMQMMSVHAKGTLHQHIPDLVGHTDHSPGPGIYGQVPVHTVAGSLAAKLLGDTVTVPCHHHQSVEEHPGLTASAYADDGVLEAVEDPNRPFWLAVQWHPEAGDDMRLFAGLVAAAQD